MKRLNFKCSLLTDIVISAQTATEGEHKSLNFIPGSNFMGILASAIYKEEDRDTSYAIFHSGKVRFGDAHIMLDDRSLQVPFSWFYPKGGKITEGKTYMIDFIDRVTNKKLMDEGIVLKQARDGYFTEKGLFLSFEKMYSQKTAYNNEKRRPKESAMFGYEALQKGSEWQFNIYIDMDDSEIIEKIIENLEGNRSLGRSKTAEYGRAFIKHISTDDNIKIEDITPEIIELENKQHSFVFLYAESRLAFRDKETGQPTFTPSAEDLGLPKEAEIVWDHSQIRTGVYAPWNWKRDCRDEDRVFIEKGSVFTVDVSDVKDKPTTEKIIKGVGFYRTEGFGMLLVNPDFLKFEQNTGRLILPLKTTDKPNNPENQPEPDSVLIKWLRQKNSFEAILKDVENFFVSGRNKFSKVTKNQWGNVRSLANSATNKEELLVQLFERPDKLNNIKGGDLYHGVEVEQWIEGRDFLEDKIRKMEKSDEYVLQFIEKLAARMQKEGGAK
jgi:hypothetical protein